MAGTQQFSITLPDDIAQMVKAKVLSGEYTDESEVICDSLSVLKNRDDARYQATLEGLADVEAGRVVAHEDVMLWADSLFAEELSPLSKV